jgi:ZIP family zinc transporter
VEVTVEGQPGIQTLMAAAFLAILAGLVALAGGLLALRLDAWRAWIVAFCAGALISAAVLLLLPDAVEILAARDAEGHGRAAYLAVVAGFFAFFLIENAEPGAEGPASHHAHGHQTGLWGAAGIALHGFVDGVAIGQAFHLGDAIGWTISIAILVHKLTDGVTVAGVMRGTEQSARATRIMIGLTALAPPAGWVLQSMVVIPPLWLGLALAWFAGVFLYLGTTSLLPAAYAARESRSVPLAALVGMLLVSGISLALH